MDQQSTHDDLCHAHNLIAPPPQQPGPYGIRVRLRRGDPFRRLLGDDWERYHWYSTPAARDRALAEMSSEHLYSRRGDRPTLIFEAVDQPAERRG